MTPDPERRLADLRRGVRMRMAHLVRVKPDQRPIPVDTRPVLVNEALKSASNDA